MGFFGSILGGANPTLKEGIKQTGQVSGTTTTQGEGLTSLAGNWLSTLLGGNQAQEAKLLAPQISTQQKQGQQAKQTMAQFGNRSGGVNSRAQTIDDTTRGNITNMISSLTGNALGQAGTMGQSLIDTGLKALGMKTDMSQMQMDNWATSIFGGAIKGGAEIGVKALGGAAGGA